jgi:hypothetical protein
LCDYIIVHELCHLAVLNHGPAFWNLVAQQIPEYQNCVAELKVIDRLGGSVARLTALQEGQGIQTGDKITVGHK